MITKYVLICIAICSYVSQFNNTIMIVRTLIKFFSEHTPSFSLFHQIEKFNLYKIQNHIVDVPYTA